MTLVDVAVAKFQMELDLEELASAENVVRFYQGGMTYSAGQVTAAECEARWTIKVAEIRQTIASNTRQLP